MQLTGTITQVLPLQEGTSKAGNPWRKQDFILSTDGQYPKNVCFHLFGDNIDKFPLAVGQRVTLEVDIESKENTTGVGTPTSKRGQSPTHSR